MPDGISLLCARTLQHSQRVIVGGKLGEFIPPDAEDGKRGHDQQALDAFLIPKLTDNGDTGKRLACAHFHEQGRAAASFQMLQREICRFTLMSVGGCPYGKPMCGF